jgi:hypothetical protein
MYNAIFLKYWRNAVRSNHFGHVDLLNKQVMGRNSVLDAAMRIHIATFDAADSGEGYNLQNCNIAADLFQNQPGVNVRYWCEPAWYRK